MDNVGLLSGKAASVPAAQTPLDALGDRLDRVARRLLHAASRIEVHSDKLFGPTPTNLNATQGAAPTPVASCVFGVAQEVETALERVEAAIARFD